MATAMKMVAPPRRSATATGLITDFGAFTCPDFQTCWLIGLNGSSSEPLPRASAPHLPPHFVEWMAIVETVWSPCSPQGRR
jgi:hypothetical protein